MLRRRGKVGPPKGIEVKITENSTRGLRPASSRYGLIALVPPKRVLGVQGSRDVGVAGRAATSAVLALTATRSTTIVGHILAQESTTHKRGAAGTSVAHLRRDLTVRQGVGAAVRLSLALVAAGHDEHGSTVQTSKTNSSDSNTSSGCGLPRRRASIASIVESIVVVIAVVGAFGIATRVAILLNVTKDVDLGVDDSGKILDKLVGVVVDTRVGSPEFNLESIKQVLRVVHLGNRGQITPLVASIKRNKHGNLNAVKIKVTSIGQSLGEVLEDLSSSNRVPDNVVVVEGVQETNLDQSGTLRLLLRRILGQDDRRNTRGKRLRGGTSWLARGRNIGE